MLRASGVFFETVCLEEAKETVSKAVAGSCLLLSDPFAHANSKFLIVFAWKSRVNVIGVAVQDKSLNTIGLDTPNRFFDEMEVRVLVHNVICKLLCRFQVPLRPDHAVARLHRHTLSQRQSSDSGEGADQSPKLMRCPASLQALSSSVIWREVVNQRECGVDKLPLPTMVKSYILGR